MPETEAVDPYFVELFIEEAKEEIESIKKVFPMWDQNPMDLESLSSMRRSFHTLKGSGRMVGARAIAEFAWSIENLLNRIIDKTLSRTPGMMACCARRWRRCRSWWSTWKPAGRVPFRSSRSWRAPLPMPMAAKRNRRGAEIGVSAPTRGSTAIGAGVDRPLRPPDAGADTAARLPPRHAVAASGRRWIRAA